MQSAFLVQTFFSPPDTPLFQQQKTVGLLSEGEWFHLHSNGLILVLGFVFFFSPASSKVLVTKKDGIGELMKFLQVL